MTEQGVTISGIRRKCKSSEGKKEFNRYLLWSDNVLSRISCYPTWLFLKLGISANQTTVIAIIIGCTGCIFLAFGSYWTAITGALLVNIGSLLDAVDGNIARYNNSSSRFGAFIDGLNAYIISALLFVCIGIGVYRHPDPVLNSLVYSLMGIELSQSIFLILGAWASFLYIFTYSIVDRAGIIFGIQPFDFYKPTRRNRRSFWNILYWAGMNVENITELVLPLLLLAAGFRFLSIFVLLYAIIATGGFVAILTRTLIKARNL